MKKERKVWAMTFIVPWLLAPGILQAQSDSVSTTTLNEVVVTATKFPKNVDQTGKVLTVIDRETIEHSTGKDLAQVLNEQAGITIVGGTSNPGKDKALSLQGASNDYTLVLIDGIPLNDPSGFGGAYDLRMIPLDNIERIEILKGSQSTLYGSDAIAGVVNIITRTKGEKAIEANGRVSYGSFGTLDAGLGVSGHTNDVDYSFGYNRLHSDGISEALKPDTATTSYDRDPSTQQAFTGSGTVKILHDFSMTPYLRYSTFDGQYDAGAFADSKVDRYSASLWNAGIRADGKIGTGTLGVLYGHENSERTYNDDFGVFRYKGEFQNADVFFNARISDRLSLLTGINGQQSKLKSSSPENAINLWSPYASVFYESRKGITVEAGGRYNFHSVYGHNGTFSLNPSWLIHDRFKLFYNISTGFKAPTLSQLYSPFATSQGLQPETSWSKEFGGEVESLDKRWTARLVGFHRKIQDLIVYLSAFDSAFYKNIGNQKDYGAELEANWIPAPHFRCSLFYAYATGKLYTTPSNSVHNLFRRPNHSFGTGFTYQFNHWITTLNLKYNGVRKDEFFDENFTLQEARLSGYALLNIHLEYKALDGLLAVFVDGRNLLDSDYQETYGYSTPRLNGDLGIRFSLP